MRRSPVLLFGVETPLFLKPAGRSASHPARRRDSPRIARWRVDAPLPLASCFVFQHSGPLSNISDNCANRAYGEAAMKITDIEAIELRVPGWAGETFDGSYDNCVILVHTDAGVTGISEVDSVPSVIKAIIGAPRSHTHAMGLKEVVVGQDPLEARTL